MSLVEAVDADTAWITEASNCRIWKTITGGDSWSQQTDMLEYIYDISAADSDNAWAVGANGLILHTSGGGLGPAPTVTSIEPDQGSQLSIWFDVTNLGSGLVFCMPWHITCWHLQVCRKRKDLTPMRP
jgi:hypothetical protein